MSAINGNHALTTGKANEEFLLSSYSTSRELCAHEVIEKQAKKTPLKIALQFEQKEFVTYQELNERANEVAIALQQWKQPATPEKNRLLVPISMEKSIELVVAILGILKAGAAYIPLEISQPEVRIQSIIETVSPVLLLSDGRSGTEKLQHIAQRTGATVATLESLLHSNGEVNGGHQPFENCKVSPSSLAYILFTSGSTGIPKGVMVEHRNLVAMMTAQEDDVIGTWTSVRAQVAPYTYAVSVAVSI